MTTRPRIAPALLSAAPLLAALLWPAPLPAAAAAPTSHVDLARHSWATPAAERRDRTALQAALDSLAADSATAPPTPGRLLSRLDLLARASRMAARHGDYFHLRAAVDNTDQASAREEDAVYAPLARAEARLRGAVAALDGPALERLVAAEPRLAPYRDYLAEQRRLGARPLPEHAAELGTLATSWQFPLYQRVLEDTDFGTVPGPDGPLDVRKQRSAIGASPDSAVREEGFRKLAAGYARHRDLYAYLLLQTVEAQNTVARAQGYADRPAQAYDARQITTAEVRALIAAVRRRGAIFQRYEQVLARARTALEGRPQPRIGWERLTAAAHAALAPLGPAYVEETDRILDPASGLLELGPGAHRQAGGFSFGLPDGTHGVYLDAFEGYPADVRRLVHESGHAVHQRLFERAGAPGLYQAALGEVVAQLGETMVTAQLVAAEPDVRDRLAWRQLFLRQILEVFLGAKDAELEQAIYDSAAAGALRSADDLDRLTAHVDSAYTADHRPLMAGRWMRAPLLIEDPLYLSNYLYSGLVMAALYEQAERAPAGFAPRYARFMRRTSAAPLRETLSRTLGLSLDDPKMLDAVFASLGREVDEFEADVARVTAR